MAVFACGVDVRVADEATATTTNKPRARVTDSERKTLRRIRLLPEDSRFLIEIASPTAGPGQLKRPFSRCVERATGSTVPVWAEHPIRRFTRPHSPGGASPSRLFTGRGWPMRARVPFATTATTPTSHRCRYRECSGRRQRHRPTVPERRDRAAGE